MEYSTPGTEDDVDMDPVIWQCSQAVELKRIFANAPVAAPAPPPVVPETSGRARNGLKRKRWQDQDAPASSSAETLGLIQQLSRTLGSCRPNNPARRNTRIASAGALMLGPSVGPSKAMPPPRKPAQSDWDSESCDEAHTPLSDATSSVWSREGSKLSISVDGSSDSNSTVHPCTPPARPQPRPATEPTTTLAALIARTESPEPPPPPTKPVLSIRTVDASAYSSRSNTSESTSTVSTTGSIVSTTAPGPISPVTPVAPRAPTPIIDISPTPSPEPRPKSKPPPRSDTPPPPKSPPPPPKPKPRQSSSRATTEPSPVSSRPSLSSQQTRSEPAPSQQFRPPTQQFRPPTQQQFRPPTQQAARAFPSSQTRLGLGAIGNGYANANRPFKVPNKGGPTKSTVVALPRRGLAGTSTAGSSGLKVTGAGTGTKPDESASIKGKEKEKPKPPASPSKAGKPKPKSASPTKQRNPSPSRRKENLVTSPEVGKSAGRTKKGGAAGTSKSGSGSGSGSGRRDRDPPSDDSYLASDGSFDAAAVDADMAQWDSWVDL